MKDAKKVMELRPKHTYRIESPGNVSITIRKERKRLNLEDFHKALECPFKHDKRFGMDEHIREDHCLPRRRHSCKGAELEPVSVCRCSRIEEHCVADATPCIFFSPVLILNEKALNPTV